MDTQKRGPCFWKDYLISSSNHGFSKNGDHVGLRRCSPWKMMLGRGSLPLGIVKFSRAIFCWTSGVYHIPIWIANFGKEKKTLGVLGSLNKKWALFYMCMSELIDMVKLNYKSEKKCMLNMASYLFAKRVRENNPRSWPMSHEKTLLQFHYTGCFIGILIMVYHNPYVTG